MQLAKVAGFDALFIDLEHSVLSLNDTAQICTAALMTGMTPFVRVPYQCGDGFVQRVLDAGAMGVVFPHILNKGRFCLEFWTDFVSHYLTFALLDDAKAAVKISKYPPMGSRSMTGQLPHYCCAGNPTTKVVEEINASGSSIFVMIETKSSIENINEIAATPGIDVLLIGSNDLCIELGVPGDFESQEYRSAVTMVSEAAKRNGKILGFAGVYDNPVIHNWVINDLGARFVLGQQDSGFIAKGAKECAAYLQGIHS